jgi:methylenetetrahydrofolate dehydrogenase (NADP+)/methenyltetrahydrofolate cyclohydrolase
MQIIDGRKIRDQILGDLFARVQALPATAVFCDVLVGESEASAQYVRMKERIARSLGIEVLSANYPETITTEELVAEIRRISATPRMAGLIVQLPLPAHINTQEVLDAVPVEIDVDAIGNEATNLFYSDQPQFIFPTAAAILAVLDTLKLDLSGKHIVVLGKGTLVGKPVAHLLARRGLRVTSVDSSTPNPERLIADADVLISGIGVANFVKGSMLKPGVVVIDAGTSEAGDSISGDAETDSLNGIASALSPVPGGVGPVTVAMLMKNVVISAERLLK